MEECTPQRGYAVKNYFNLFSLRFNAVLLGEADGVQAALREVYHQRAGHVLTLQVAQRADDGIAVAALGGELAVADDARGFGGDWRGCAHRDVAIVDRVP